jgi:hypothetical protein
MRPARARMLAAAVKHTSVTCPSMRGGVAAKGEANVSRELADQPRGTDGAALDGPWADPGAFPDGAPYMGRLTRTGGGGRDWKTAGRRGAPLGAGAGTL